MQRSNIAIIIVVLILALGAGAAWVAFNNQNNNQSSQNQEQTHPQTENQTSTATTSDATTDFTSQEKIEVIMSELAYKPANIKIKKGATVTWTNNDTVGHNVVAADPSNAGGLPTSSPTFGRGGTYSMTFNTVGTFDYLCTPHKSFMRGTVQVVE